MDSAHIASLLHEFQRSLSLLADDQDAPMPLESPAHTCLLPSTPRSTDARFCPRPPTPPPSRRPPKHLKRPAPIERSDTAKRVQPDSARLWPVRRRDEDEGVPRVQNQRTRFTTPDSDEERERAWICHPTDTARRASGPLRSILRNKHAGTPYQRLPTRRAVRWAAAP